MSTDTPFLSAALAAAERGWRVFPLRPGTKRPALHRFDRCPRTGPCAHAHQGWEQRATTDPDRIRTAWTPGTTFNIGVATGPSGLVVIDLDAATPGETPPAPWDQPGITDGQDVLAVLAEQAGQPLPVDTLTVSTPSGLHLYYRAPEDTALRNTQGDRGHGLGWKIDTRAHGGYVLAPGSSVDGRPYAITHDTTPAPLPGWLADRLHPAPLPPPPERPAPVASSRRGRYLQAAIDAETTKVIDAPKGQRNAALYAAAVALGQLVAGEALTEADVTDTLMRAARKHTAIGAYSERQASATITSGLRAGATRPRQVAA